MTLVKLDNSQLVLMKLDSERRIRKSNEWIRLCCQPDLSTKKSVAFVDNSQLALMKPDSERRIRENNEWNRLCCRPDLSTKKSVALVKLDNSQLALMKLDSQRHCKYFILNINHVFILFLLHVLLENIILIVISVKHLQLGPCLNIYIMFGIHFVKN